jgi:hypothetical protein
LQTDGGRASDLEPTLELCYTQRVHGHRLQGPRAAARPRRRRRAPVPLEQLALDLASGAPRWTFSRLIRDSPHQPRIVERLEFVRRFFPELDSITIHVGRAIRRDVLGWGSMDPARPGIWVRPRRLAFFTIAHELTHLLQARGLVPGGERACDLWALARSPLVIDSMPGYLKLPRPLRDRRVTEPSLASLLCRLAREAIARRESGDRRYLATFESELAHTFEPRPWRRRAPRISADAATLRLGLDA